MKLRVLTPIVLLFVLIPDAAPTVRADISIGAPILFPQTGHTLAYNFREFYEALNGPIVFGLPLTEVLIEERQPVQYFERARMAWHADLGQVHVADLGRWAAAGRQTEPPFVPVGRAAVAADATFFDATKHTLGGDFRSFYNQFGGRAIFGYPISESFQEVDQPSGQPHAVQYFERARFELHPELPWPYTVSLGHLGRQYLAAHPVPEAALRPVATPAQAWDGLRPTHISVPRVGVDVDVEERGSTMGRWDVPHADVGHFWPIAAYPGTAGNIILGGHSDYPDRIFNHLPQARIGDAVLLTAGGRQRRYIVKEMLVVLPQDTWVLKPTSLEQLTLITCVPYGINSHRLIVRAAPED
jgi:LPXTG-site transpeptidase (sortase) family protein